MPTFEITPADDESLVCSFTIPRESGAPIMFSVRRIEYLPPAESKAYDDWLTARLQEDPQPASRELILKKLEISLPKATYSKLATLTSGELTQVFEHWVAASKTAEEPAS